VFFMMLSRSAACGFQSGTFYGHSKDSWFKYFSPLPTPPLPPL
jgi:hypothetical protein